MIQSFFGGIGKIRTEGKLSVSYTVTSIKDLSVIIEHYDKYPLITQKRADYLLFKKAFEIVKRKEHLTLEGVNSLVKIKASINNGLTEKLKNNFANAIPVFRPLVQFSGIPDPHWVAGFSTGEGCFSVVICKSKSSKLKYSIQLNYYLNQNKRDHLLLSELVNYFSCGNINLDHVNNTTVFYVSKFLDINGKIIPFFKQYPILGSKRLDYEDFCRVNHLMKEKKHLTIEGLELIKKIKNEMNRFRT